VYTCKILSMPLTPVLKDRCILAEDTSAIKINHKPYEYQRFETLARGLFAAPKVRTGRTDQEDATG